MPKLTKLSISTAALMLALIPTAFAQDNTPDVTAKVQTVDPFTSADIDADGALDRNEFVSFVVIKSDEGAADYSSIKLSGKYDDHFDSKDYNADGLLTAEELKVSAEASDKSKQEGESESMIDEPG